MDNTDGWSIDAQLGFPPLEAMGWTIDAMPWRGDDVDWNRYDAVYIGTPWDYPDDPDRFMRVLGDVDRSAAILVNDYALVSWAMPKTYLRDLERKGVEVVPGRWGERLDAGMIDDAFERFGTGQLIVKPVISTNAANTFLLPRDIPAQVEAQLRETFSDRACVIQPFIENIRSDGEYSLFYFNRRFSHAIRKIPQRGDFRAQEERGAEIVAAKPETALRDAGARLLEMVEPMPVYARADFVRGADDRYLLMELELVEPSMYLRMDKNAPRRFAEAFDDYVNEASANAREK